MSRNKERRIQHYKSSQKILLVGEGDFSFSACLAKAFRYADNMVATCLESQEWFNKNHWSSVSNVDCLESRECWVLFEVDAHDMDKHPTLADMRFDVIVFNFPHAGHVSWLCESDTILIERHKRLLRGFFRSARELLDKNGEIHVTHRDDEPYCQWELEKQAQTAGLVLKEKVPFVKERYQGYHNKRGSDIQGNKKFPILFPFTSKFWIITGRDCNNQIPPAMLTDTVSVSETFVGGGDDRSMHDEDERIVTDDQPETKNVGIVGDNNHNLLVDDFKKIAISDGDQEEIKPPASLVCTSAVSDLVLVCNDRTDFDGNCEDVKNSLVNDEVVAEDSTIVSDGKIYEQDEINSTESEGHDLDDDHQEITGSSTVITAPSSATDCDRGNSADDMGTETFESKYINMHENEIQN